MLDLDIKTLQLLVLVCDLGNMKRAAEQAHIEPSAISKRIALLEARLGVPLLLRGRRGVQPTAAGQAVLEHARSVLFTLERLRADVAAFAGGVRGQVKIGASASAIAQVLLDDLADFARVATHQGIDLSVQEHLSRDVVRRVRGGTITLGVCWDAVDTTGLQTRPYREDELVLAVHARHPLAGQTRVRFADTLAHDFAGLPPSTSVHTMLNRAAAQAGHEIRYRTVVSGFETALRAVLVSQCVSVLPRQIVQRAAHEGACIVTLDEPWAVRRFVLSFREGTELPPATARLVDFLSARADAPAPDTPALPGH